MDKEQKKVAIAENTCGAAIADMVRSMERYCKAYATAIDGLVGADYVIGDDGVKEIMRGLRVLLNGPTGRAVDCGTLDAAILRISRANGLDIE